MVKATTQFYWEDKSRWWTVEALDSVASKRVKAFIGGVDGPRLPVRSRVFYIHESEYFYLQITNLKEWLGVPLLALPLLLIALSLFNFCDLQANKVIPPLI
jgi:hypothetical protein